MQKVVLGLSSSLIPSCQNPAFKSKFENILARVRLENKEFLLRVGIYYQQENDLKANN